MKLFEPIKIRGMILKNRIYMLSMGSPGQFGDIAINYYVARAKGGVAAITSGLVSTWEAVLDNIEAMSPFTEAVHDAAPDCKLAIQTLPFRENDKYSCSSVPLSKATRDSFVGGRPQPPIEFVAMTKNDIKLYVKRLAESAFRQKQIGFDYVELHGTHAYLFRQFFSPLDNHREDEYGGTLENRMRFPLESVRAIRSAVGEDFPIFYKIPAVEEEFGGITLDESARFAIELEKTGVDVLVVTQGVTSHARGYLNSVIPLYNYLPLGSFTDYAAFIKRYVNIPVVAAGRINKPELAESILQEGKADIIGIGRQLIADPDWPNKVASGAWGDIRPCLSCNSCLDWTYQGEPSAPLPCAVNAQACREIPNRIVSTSKPKKVVVVGGGAAGMEAARIAAERGHDVTLYEKESSLGGALAVASKPPMKEQIEDFRRYLVIELNRTGVKVKLGKAADVATIKKEKSDAVVIATGARPRGLNIPGATAENVTMADDVLMGKAHPGQRVLVVGGGLVGLETAQFLSAQGKAVSLVEMLPEVGMDISPQVRAAIIQKTKDAGVVLYVNSQPQEITEVGVRVNIAGTSELMRVDSVVLAVGRESDKTLEEQLRGKIPELHIVGDCVSPRRIRDAIHDGHRVGRIL